MAETEYTNGVLHNSKLNVSVDFLNIFKHTNQIIRFTIAPTKSNMNEYQIKITYFFQKKKEPDLYGNFIFHLLFDTFNILKILYKEEIKRKRFTICLVQNPKKEKEFLIKIDLATKLEGKE